MRQEEKTVHRWQERSVTDLMSFRSLFTGFHTRHNDGTSGRRILPREQMGT